jgi:hypothetical protein
MLNPDPSGDPCKAAETHASSDTTLAARRHARSSKVQTLRSLVADVGTLVSMARLALVNRLARRPIVEVGGPVVSLTSYSRRVLFVHLAIESIGRGTLRPSRLILWLDEEGPLAKPPRSLRRLERRGLEIKSTDDFGPHKKYFPYVEGEAQHSVPLVTADDDLLYPRDWLATLVAAYRPEERVVVAHRVHRIAVLRDDIAPYVTWGRATSGRPSARHFATGGSGLVLPPAVLDHLRELGRQFEGRAPTADDVWLNFAILHSGHRVRPLLHLDESDYGQTRGIGRHRVEPLLVQNVFRGGNDRQIAQTYDVSTKAAVLADV